LIRSLTLIRNLDISYRDSTTEVDKLAKLYGQLPNSGNSDKTAPQALRLALSHALDQALISRESSYAEASRLYDSCDRHYNRLSSILTKLQALPLPPSRDPTPVQQPTPALNRSRFGSRSDAYPRITLRLDTTRRGRGSGRRGRRSPSLDGEDESAWESDIQSSGRGSRLKGRKSPTQRKYQHGGSGLPKIRVPKPQALRTLRDDEDDDEADEVKTPPPDPQAGSEDAPWLRLTPFELARVRKRMKKNSVWQPSQSMIARELKSLGRGSEAYQREVSRLRDLGLPPPDAGPASQLSGELISVQPLQLGATRHEPIEEGSSLKPGKESTTQVTAETTTKTKTTKAGHPAQLVIEAGRKIHTFSGSTNGVVSPEKQTSMTSPERPQKSPKKPSKQRKGDITPLSPLLNTPKTPSADLPLREDRKRKRESQASPTSVSTIKTTMVPVEPLDATYDIEAGGASSKSRKSALSTSTIKTPIPPPTASGIATRPRRDISVSSTPIPPPEINDTGKLSKIQKMPAIELKPPPTSASKVKTALSKLLQPPLLRRTSRVPVPGEEDDVPHANLEPPKSIPSEHPATRTQASSFLAVASLNEDDDDSSSLSSVGSVSVASLTAGSRLADTTAKDQQEGSEMDIDEMENNEDSLVEAIIANNITRVDHEQRLRHENGVLDGEEEEEEDEEEDDLMEGQIEDEEQVEEPDDEAPQTEAEDEEVDSDGGSIDSNEPTYCLCDRVSFGTMVCCENERCDKQWFHLECVGLDAAPGRTQKWYCPNCRGDSGPGSAKPAKSKNKEKAHSNSAPVAAATVGQKSSNNRSKLIQPAHKPASILKAESVSARARGTSKVLPPETPSRISARRASGSTATPDLVDSDPTGKKSTQNISAAAGLPSTPVIDSAKKAELISLKSLTNSSKTRAGLAAAAAAETAAIEAAKVASRPPPRKKRRF
jgi:hypothetical protein